MLTMFKIEDQFFYRVGDETRPTGSGRTVKLGLWMSPCPDCGQAFKEAHRDRGFVPAKCTLRRCQKRRKVPVRKGLQLVHQPFRVHPAQCMPANGELAGSLASRRKPCI
jgi:hypothetical protein